MYAIKNTATGKFYTGRKEPNRWGQRCEAKWLGKTYAKATLGGLRNNADSLALRIVSIND